MNKNNSGCKRKYVSMIKKISKAHRAVSWEEMRSLGPLCLCMHKWAKRLGHLLSYQSFQTRAINYFQSQDENIIRKYISTFCFTLLIPNVDRK